MPLKPVRAFQILSRTSAESVPEVAPVVDMTGGAKPRIPPKLLDVDTEKKRVKLRERTAARRKGKKSPRSTKEEVAARPPTPDAIRTKRLTQCNADFLPQGVVPPDGDGMHVRTVDNATADEIIAYTGGRGPVTIVSATGRTIHPRSLMIMVRGRPDWEVLREEIREKYPALLSGKGLDGKELAERASEAAENATTAITQGYMPPLLHRSQKLHDPDNVADALEAQKFGPEERVKLLLDIAYDESISGKDRLQALEIIDKTVVRCSRILKAAQSSWQGVVERSVMEGVIRGDKTALEIAVASGKAEGFKLPEKAPGPGTAVQVNVSGATTDPFAGLSPEKRARLAEIDVMLGGAVTPPPIIDQVQETPDARAECREDSSPPRKAEGDK